MDDLPVADPPFELADSSSDGMTEQSLRGEIEKVIYENDDNVGIIDGLLKLYMPDVYYSWSNRKKRINERYNDG